MYCNKCGAQSDERASICQRCGASLNNPYAGPVANAGGPGAGDINQYGRVSNYLVQAILVTVCCCMPFGIPAIVYAAQVNPKMAGGDYDGALAASSSAKMWTWIAFGIGLTAQALYFGLVGLSAVGGNVGARGAFRPPGR